MDKLTLYHFDGCPYCSRVKDFLKQNNITISMRDIHTEVGTREELLKIGGKAQVPCLVIDGKALYESVDIINWFKSNWKK